MLRTGPGMLHAGPGMLRDAPCRPGVASRVESADAPVGCGTGTLRRVRVGGARGRCGQPGSRTPPGAALIAAAAPPPVNTAAPVLSMGGTAPPGPLAAGRGGISGSANGNPPERGCWREWQGDTPQYPPVNLPRHPGSSRCPHLSSTAPPVPSHEHPGTPVWAPPYLSVTSGTHPRTLQLLPVPTAPPVWASRCPRCPLHPHVCTPGSPPRPLRTPENRTLDQARLSPVPPAKPWPGTVPVLGACRSRPFPPRRGVGRSVPSWTPPPPATQRRLRGLSSRRGRGPPVGERAAHGAATPVPTVTRVGPRPPAARRGAARPSQATPLPAWPRPPRGAAGDTNGAAAAALLPRRPRAARQGPRPLATAGARGPAARRAPIGCAVAASCCGNRGPGAAPPPAAYPGHCRLPRALRPTAGPALPEPLGPAHGPQEAPLPGEHRTTLHRGSSITLGLARGLAAWRLPELFPPGAAGGRARHRAPATQLPYDAGSAHLLGRSPQPTRLCTRSRPLARRGPEEAPPCPPASCTGAALLRALPVGRALAPRCRRGLCSLPAASRPTSSQAAVPRGPSRKALRSGPHPSPVDPSPVEPAALLPGLLLCGAGAEPAGGAPPPPLPVSTGPARPAYPLAVAMETGPGPVDGDVGYGGSPGGRRMAGGHGVWDIPGGGRRMAWGHWYGGPP